MTDRETFEAWAIKEGHAIQGANRWRDGFDRHSAWLAWQEAARQERERAQALTSAAEQFVAWQGEENQGGMLDYFEDIFSEALRSRSSPPE